MIELTLTDSNFGHQQGLDPFINSQEVVWRRDGIRRKVNVFTDNFIKQTHVDVPQDENFNVCILLEPYTNPPWTDIYDYIRTDFEKFDLIITHNKEKLSDLLELRPDKFHYSTQCITRTWLEQKHINLHPKSRNISMPVNFKNFSEGHRIRHVIYEKYKDSGIIDFFGEGIPDFKGDFRQCFIDYKYTIIAENCLQKGFHSEKLNDAILTGCIPIYWGTNIEDLNYDKSSILPFAPNKPKVDFEFDESLNNLEEVLKILTETNYPYDTLLSSIKKNYDYTLSNLIPEDNVLRILKNRNMLD